MNAHSTSLQEEIAHNAVWRPRPGRDDGGVFDELVRNEFRAPADLHARQCRTLTTLTRFAIAHSPWYTRVFEQHRLRAADVCDPAHLPRLPVLGRYQLVNEAASLRSRSLPRGDEVLGVTRSSGSTGAPVSVPMTRIVSGFYSILEQRNYRWFRLDPRGTLVDARIGGEISRGTEGRSHENGRLIERDRWRGVGSVFETGPEYAFSMSRPMEQQVEWLQRLRPDYALSYLGVFEEWALASGDRCPVDSLRGLMGVGSHLTTALAGRLARLYPLPLHISYGLNEVGRVAVRCAAGRYHVHAEHVIVEVVDDDGQPCAPGETGRLLVTSLNNFALPLLRYDSGDLGVAAGGPCGCGRTLPSFAGIAGRLRRFASLPDGTRPRLNAILAAIEAMPHELMRCVRQYQVHQRADGGFELRLRLAATLPESFVARVQAAWRALESNGGVPLVVREVDHISASPSGKLLDFTSDLYEDAYGRPST